MKHSLFVRATALLLSWIFSATTVWSAAPPLVSARPGVAAPLPRVATAADPAPDPHPWSASPDPVPTHGGDDDQHEAVRPILECVVEDGGGRFTAHFGYDNENDDEITIPKGTKNKFTPAPEDRGQPTRFERGRTPAYPNAAFLVSFDGGTLNWTLKGPDGESRSVTASSSSPRCPAPPSPGACSASFFGPKRYARTCGSQTIYTDRIDVPAWVKAPYVLKVQNGESNGAHRVSSARINVNGVQVAGPSDFGQNKPGFERTVTPSTNPFDLRVTLTSKPGSYLYTSFCGQSGDKTAPLVAWSEPGPATNDPTPRLVVQYRDETGAGEPGASGVDTATFRAFLDDVDRTSLFTKRSSDASADLPDSLALSEGLHRLKAQIRDVAGNQGEWRLEFRVDRTPPTLKVTEPASGAFLGGTSARVRVQYADEAGLDLASLRVFINGSDRTSLFTKGPEEAVATLDLDHGLKDGLNQVLAKTKDHAGNEATDAISFTLDRKPPTLLIGQPAAGSRNGTPEIEVIVEYADDQGLDLASFRATIDGAPVDLTAGPERAVGRVGPLADGPHTLAVRILDRARNESTASVPFTVDTSAPALSILHPAAGFVIATRAPLVLIGYEDAQGIDAGSLKVRINGADLTSLFEIGPDGAMAALPPDTLPEGSSTIVVEIKDTTGNRAETSSTFTVDTKAPTGRIDAPPLRTNVRPPAVAASYSDPDPGTGVAVAVVRVFLDGTDVTARFAIGSTAATGLLDLDPPVADGAHEVSVHLADRAGNTTDITGPFFLDTVAPSLAIAAPAPDSFTNDSTPALRLVYSDPGGTGVDLGSVRLFIRQGSDPFETEITSAVEVRGGEAVGAVPASLADDAYHLRAVARDLAGNERTATASFEVDTIVPKTSVAVPADTAVLGTTTPSFEVLYQDDRSGVDLARFAFLVDGNDLTDRLTRAADKATGTLPPADALAQGDHVVDVSVFDRAGNTASVQSHFTVDTVAPTAAVELPVPDSFLEVPVSLVRVRYADTGAQGVYLPSVRILIDGVDRTAEFSVEPDRAEATLAVPLGDGSHEVRLDVADWAGNSAWATSRFVVDTLPPVVTPSCPAAFVGTTPLELSGTVTDADPALVVECEGTVRVPAVVTGSSFTCSVPLSEGPNTVRVLARDRFGREGSATCAVALDTIPPKVTILRPMDGDYVSATALDVSGGVVDASPVTVRVEGTEAVVTGATFTAGAVPIGSGPQVTLRAVAVDAVGNEGPASVTVNVDRTAPTVKITTPAAGSFHAGPMLDVAGSFTSGSPAMVEVNGQPATVSGTSFQARLPVVDGPLTLQANLRNAAGLAAADQVPVTIDGSRPVIVVSQPPAGTVTKAAALTIEGGVTDATPVTLTEGGAPVPVAPDGSFSFEASLPAADGPFALSLAATDAAGNVGTLDHPLVIDRTPPALEIVSPTEGAVLGGLPVVVQGLVHDASPTTVTVDGQEAVRTGEAWQASFPDLPEGPHTFTVVATDAAGNEKTRPLSIVLEFAPPEIHITSPASGLVTRASAVDVSGTVKARGGVTVEVNGTAATVTGEAFLAANVPLAEGDNQVLAKATSATGRTADDQIVVTRDSIAPTLTLTAPETIAPDRPGQAVATATDAGGLHEIVLRVDGSVVAICPTSPCVADLVAPPDAENGETLLVTAEATDGAGNVSTRSRAVQVVSKGVVVGLVLSDGSSLPLEGATVRIVSGPAGLITTTDERGLFSIPVSSAMALLAAEAPGMTSVDREAHVLLGVGNVVVDARLTPLAAPHVVGPDGGTVHVSRDSTSALTLTIPAGAVSVDTSFRLTPLSGQGLPGLLPLGWSPISAFDLRTDTGAPPLVPLPLKATGLPALTLHLVRYRSSTHDWVMVAPSLTPTVQGELVFELQALGAYALAAADEGDPPIVIPAAGSALDGISMVAIPVAANSEGVVTPSVIAPTGGTAQGTLTVRSPQPLPSGTVVQTVVRETYTLASGDVASVEKRLQDILVYRQPAPAAPPAGQQVPPPGGSLGAVFPITPSRTFGTTELREGAVDLDILSGREGVRGKSGGSSAVQVETAGARLSVRAGALGEETALSLESPELSGFLPSSAGLVPLQELVLDFSGRTLQIGAELSIASPGVSPDDTLFVARVERGVTGGIPRLALVALAELVADRIVTKAHPELPGITEEGRYVFYRSASPLGLVKGTTQTGTGPVAAVVEAVGLPLIGLPLPNGGFVLAAIPGASVTVTARIPGTTFEGSGSVSVAALPEPAASLSLTLAGTQTTATVTPADGAVALPVNVQVEIATTNPIDPASVSADFIRLEKPSGDPVPVRFVLSGSRKLLAVVPQNALDFATTFTLRVTLLRDSSNGLIAVPVTSFTTKDDTPPVYDWDALTFSFPNPETGLVKVTAPANSFPWGTDFLVINSVNGVVITFKAENNGAVGELLPITLPATIDDQLLITITDPLGNVTTFSRSRFVQEDGTVAIGPGGGTVDGPGGVELRIPMGALEKGVELKIEAVTAEELLAEFPGQVPELGKDGQGNTLVQLGSGLKVTSKDQPSFRKPVDLVFPLPDFTKAPPDQQPDNVEDAYYYVVRRIEGPCPDGSDTCPAAERPALFQTIDHAFVECPNKAPDCPADQKRVVTASWPFSAYMDSYGAFGLSPGEGFSLNPVAANFAYLLWSFNQSLPRKAVPGVIAGKVQRTKWNPGAATPDYEPIKGAFVTGVDADGKRRLLTNTDNVSITREDGSFTLWDPDFQGGTVTVAATLERDDGTVMQCPVETPTLKCATAFEANTKDWENTGLRFHQHIATASITFPPVEPPPPPPAIEVKVFRLVEGNRVDTRGIVSAGTPVILGLKLTKGLTFRSVQVQGLDESARQDPLAGQATGVDWIVDYTPSRVGTYKVEARALTPFAELVEGVSTFRVIGAGGRDEVIEDQAPSVISDQTVPKKGLTGVPVSTFIQIVFSEPVRKVPGNVTLFDSANQSVGIKLSGVKRGGETIDDLFSSPDTPITSLTVQPLVGLQYGATYRLSLTDGIEDLDAVTKKLEPYETTFTTFSPLGLTEKPETWGSPGIVVLQDRAYLVENFFHSGMLRAYKTDDPVTPEEVESARFVVSYRPIDIAGEEESPLTGGRLVAVATGPIAQSRPWNVWLLDVSNDAETKWIGAVSLANSAGQAYISRIIMRSGFLYTATHKKGVQVVDLGPVKDAFKDPGTPEFFDMSRAFLTDGRGYAQENVVDIPVASRFGGPARLEDLEADLFTTGPAESQLLVVAVGDSGLSVVNPATRQVVYSGPVVVQKDDGQGGKREEARLLDGYAVGLGRIGQQPVAVITGRGTVQAAPNQALLVVASMADPAKPVGLGYVPVSGVVDVLVKDDLALLGTATQVIVVSLANLSQPRVIGTIAGVGGRLALGENNILFGTERSVFGGTDLPLGGVRTAALGTMTFIKSAPAVVVDIDGKSIEPQPIKYRALFPLDEVETSEIEVTDNGALIQRLEASLDPQGSGEVKLPAGTKHSPLKARLVINRDKPPAERPSHAAEKLLRAASFDVEPRGGAEMMLPADADPLVITALNEALQERLAESRVTGKKVDLPALSWVVAGDGGATVEPVSEALPATGLYSSTYLPSRLAGSLHRVELRLGSTVLGRSAPIRVVPGQACSAQVEGAVANLPADGTSKRKVRIYEVKDCFGNTVPDGRAVTWEVLPPEPVIGPPGSPGYALMPGSLKSATTYIANGESTNEYVAGIEPGLVRFGAHVDENLTKPFLVTQAPLGLDLQMLILSEQQRHLSLTVGSEAGPSPDGTPVGWGLTAGRLDAQQTLASSAATAIFTWPLDPKQMTIGVPYVFATVGRERTEVDAEILGAVPPSPGLFLKLLGQYLLGDASGGSSFEIRDAQGGVAFSVPSEITVKVGGGSPGQEVPLTLDSYRLPAYLPVSHYTFDGVAEVSGVSATSDLFEVAPATVGDGVDLDTAERAEGPASLRFSLEGDPATRGVTVSVEGAFTPSGSFGISGYVRLDSATEQTIVSKEGAYEVAVVLVDGQPHLEFAVVNGGVRKTVVSPEVLVVGAWYHFSARLEQGYLQLHLGEGGIVKVGDAAAPPDLTNNPLRIGPSFEGHLDEMAFFDFTGTPTVVFEDAGTRTTVTLNELGEGQVRLRSTGAFQGVPLAALNRYARNFVRIEAPPVLPQDWVMTWLDLDRALRQHYGMYVTAFLSQCGAGVADGESGGSVGLVCDLWLNLISLFPPAAALNVGLSGRDAVVGTNHFIQGKDKSASILKASLGVIGVLAATANPISRIARLGRRAHAAAEGAEVVDRLVMRETLETLGRKLGSEEAAVPKLLEALGDETGRVAPQTQKALVEILAKSDDIAGTAQALERLGNVYEYERLLVSLDGAVQEIASNSALAPTLARGLGARLVQSLDEIARTAELAGVVPKLSDEAIKGAAVLLARRNSNQILRLWTHIGRLNPTKQVSAFDDIMKWIAEGERAKIPGWVEFLRNGPGAAGFGPQKTQGAYAVLEYLSTNLKWKNVVELERPLGKCFLIPWLGITRCQRYVDIVVGEVDDGGRLTGRELFKEVKNLKAEATFGFGSQVKFDVNRALQDSLNATGGLLVEADLARRLRQIEYVLRGSPEEMAAVINGLTKTIEKVLSSQRARQLAKHVKITPLSLPLPI